MVINFYYEMTSKLLSKINYWRIKTKIHYSTKQHEIISIILQASQNCISKRKLRLVIRKRMIQTFIMINQVIISIAKKSAFIKQIK